MIPAKRVYPAKPLMIVRSLSVLRIGMTKHGYNAGIFSRAKRSARAIQTSSSTNFFTRLT